MDLVLVSLLLNMNRYLNAVEIKIIVMLIIVMWILMISFRILLLGRQIRDHRQISFLILSDLIAFYSPVIVRKPLVFRRFQGIEVN